MCSVYYRSALFIAQLLICCGIVGPLCAQDKPTITAEISSSLAEAEELLIGFKNDSVYQIASRVLEVLRERKELNSDLGIHAQLLEGIALEQDQNDTIALQKLLRVKELSREKELWKIYTRATLTLSNLFEKIGFEEQAFLHLQDAKIPVEKYQLDTLYALFAIRSASHNRIFGDKYLALFYAKEVLKTSQKFGLKREEAIGHLLMGLLHHHTDFEKARDYFLRAGNLYLDIDDYVSVSFIKNNLSRLYRDNGRLPEALLYIDSMIVASQKAIEMGYERHYAVARAYRTKAELYRELGQPDSAWLNLQKAYDLQLDNFSQGMEDKVLEMDARYNNALKEQRIQEQARQLKLEKDIKSLLAGLFLVVFLFALMLTFYFFKLRKVNKKIGQQAVQLKELDAAKSRFFANVSHELRTPLTLMLGPVQTLLKGKQLTDKQSQLLQMTERNGKQLQQLVNEILDLRKLEMGKMEIQGQPTPLTTFFRQHFAQFESLAERKQINFSYQVFIEKDKIALIDPEKCRQILSNLLSNAFKFTPDSGRISAKVTIEGEELKLTVADSGPGIHPEDLPHLFDRYFQTKRPNKPAEGGTGIGLSLCKEYAELFGGKIEVESSLGKGSIFKLFFPISLVEPKEVYLKTNLERNDGDPQSTSDNLAKPAPTSSIQSRFSGTSYPASNPALAGQAIQPPRPTILVVEDNPDLQDYIRLILSDHYEVVTAGNGQEALEMLHQRSTINDQRSTNHYQLVLSDLMMPVMDGYQLLEKIKSNNKTAHLPVVMLTARADIQDKLKALRIGVDDYLIKPFDEEELLVRIENLLKNQVARFQELEQESPSETDGPVLSPEDLEWLESFESYVTENLSGGILDVSLLAQEFAMSQSTLLRQLKRLTGLTTNQYLNEVRLNEARRLLESDDRQSVSIISDKVGYTDPRSFSRSFKKRFGKLPSEI